MCYMYIVLEFTILRDSPHVVMGQCITPKLNEHLVWSLEMTKNCFR